MNEETRPIGDESIVNNEKIKHISFKNRKGRTYRTKLKNVVKSEIKSLSLTFFAQKSSNLTLTAARAVVDQLGYIPYNLIQVARFVDVDESCPAVVQLYPLNKNDLFGRYAGEFLPFPTMFWMSNTDLHTKISALEDSGQVLKLQARLWDSPQDLIAMEEAHKKYAEERWSLLSDEDRELVIEKGWEKSIRTKGIAGIRDYTAVKCLHCHYAHYLARPEHGNVIGEWVERLLETVSL